MRLSMEDDDHFESVRAFVEKRAPTYTGQ